MTDLAIYIISKDIFKKILFIVVLFFNANSGQEDVIPA